MESKIAPIADVLARVTILQQQLGDATLVFDLDIDGTLTIDDLTGNQKDRAALRNEFLSKCTFGTSCAESWKIKESEPMIASPGTISYYEHYRKIYPGPENERKLKDKAAAFITTEGQSMQPEYDAMIRGSESLLFASLFLLIKTFPKAKFVFRTFGSTGPDAIKELERLGYLRAALVPRYEIVSVDGARKVCNVDSLVNLSYSEFNAALCASKQTFFIVQENYKLWNDAGRVPEAGKFALGESGIVHIVFDDIAPKCWSSSGPFVSIYAVPTYEACTNPEYFVRSAAAELEKLGLAASRGI